MASHLSDSRYLLKCDALSCEEVVKTVQSSPRRNKELHPVRDFFPSMLLYGARSLFRTNFARCHALRSVLTSSLASPMNTSILRIYHHLQHCHLPSKQVHHLLRALRLFFRSRRNSSAPGPDGIFKCDLEALSNSPMPLVFSNNSGLDHLLHSTFLAASNHSTYSQVWSSYRAIGLPPNRADQLRWKDLFYPCWQSHKRTHDPQFVF